ncbi:hypothetical protein TYRP_017733 [Tyrophagus putrescentiae]|nr:hypothetical protein TYRP_017733 [Tyrophagus putrescentiae]
MMPKWSGLVMPWEQCDMLEKVFEKTVLWFSGLIMQMSSWPMMNSIVFIVDFSLSPSSLAARSTINGSALFCDTYRGNMRKLHFKAVRGDSSLRIETVHEKVAIVANVQLWPELIVLDGNLRQLRLVLCLEDVQRGHRRLHVLLTFVEVVEERGLTGELAEKKDSPTVVAKEELAVGGVAHLKGNGRSWHISRRTLSPWWRASLLNCVRIASKAALLSSSRTQLRILTCSSSPSHFDW